MEWDNTIVYGLETQARALASQHTENDEIRFFIATQTPKPQNQLHLLELDESTTILQHRIFTHPLGEVWKLNGSPHDSRIVASCYSSLKGSQMVMKTALYELPESLEIVDNKEFMSFTNTEILNTEPYGNDIRTTEFHPSDRNLLATVVDEKILLHERTESQTRVVTEINTKNSPKFTTGKWSQHHQGNQFIALIDCSVRAYDIRDPNNCAWSIDEAHYQMIRDLDCNPNKHCHIATAGDDGVLNIWDTRYIKDAVFVRKDHQHWIWSVRFNSFHDQLLLTSGSDCKVLLTCAASVSSEAENEGSRSGKGIPDGLLHTYDQHEDSIYCVEWSTVDAWVFASLSYDGRICISKIPKEYKLQILS